VLPRSRSVGAAVGILALGCRTCRGSVQRLPRHFGSFLAGLFKIAVVSPEVRPVFATVDEDAAGPCCPDAYRRCKLESAWVGHVADGQGYEPRGSE
jgi:hypothetical protein